MGSKFSVRIYSYPFIDGIKTGDLIFHEKFSLLLRDIPCHPIETARQSLAEFFGYVFTEWL